MTSKTDYFWHNAPALYYALFLLLGIFFACKNAWALLFLPLLLWKKPLHRASIALLLFLCALSYVQHFFYFPPSESEGVFTFHTTSLQIPKKNFTKMTTYRGIVTQAEINSSKRRCHLPMTLKSNEILEADYDYTVQGTLHTDNGQWYSLVATSVPQAEGRRNWSFLKRRESGKEWVKEYIRKTYQESQSAHFLLALTTGKIDDYLLRAHLTQIGCAHLLAISGFHFALIAGFCFFLMRPFFHFKVHIVLLLFLLSCYFLFLGKSASICRAFIFALCFFIAPLVEVRSTAINTLGVALGLSLLIDPFMAFEVGFQLSFLATAAIITFYPFLRRHFLSPSYGRCRRFFAEGLTLTLTVQGVLVPFCLFYFHQIQLHSLFYNILLPPLTACTLITFLSAMMIHPFVPPLAKAIHSANQWMTNGFLNVVEQRIFYEKTLFIASLPEWVIVLFFILFYKAAVYAFPRKYD